MYSIINLENDPELGIVRVSKNPKGLFLIEFLEPANANKAVVTLLESQYRQLANAMKLRNKEQFRRVSKA